MNIAVFHELPFGGARDGVYHFCKELTKNGAVVDLYYVNNKKIERNNSFFRNVYYYRFIPKKWVGNDWRARLYIDTIELYKLNGLHKKIAQKINSNNYDFLFINGSKYIEAPFILKYLSAFKVFYCHDPNYRIIYEKILLKSLNNLNFLKRNYERINRSIRKYLDKINFNKTDLIIANSIFSKKIIEKTYSRISKVVYPGVDINFFTPKKETKNIDIFYIGSYEKIDGFDLLKKTLLNLPDDIVLKTKMHEDGWISDYGMIRDFYRQSNLVICLSFSEPFGSVPIEAMACGVPVIAVNEGGYKETIVDGKTGYLVKRDSRVLAEKINLLLKNPSLARKLGENGRKHVLKNFTWEKSTKKLENLFSELLNE